MSLPYLESILSISYVARSVNSDIKSLRFTCTQFNNAGTLCIKRVLYPPIH